MGGVLLCQRHVYCVRGTLLPYSAWHRPFRFTRLRPNVCHAHSYTERSRDLPRPSQQGHTAAWCIQCLAWYIHYIHGLTPTPVSVSAVGTHYNSGDLIPECNALSQFRENTGKPSVPVPEFNLLACPLVQSR